MSKTLVAYFSATGVTRKVAGKLAEAVSGTLYEIQPETPYTQADFNWRDKQSRSSLENANPDARPAIKGHVDNMAQYDRVFVGFPIWWYREPRIIDTFLESEDFAGKTVIPFATSGSSPIGDSGKYMQDLAPKAKVVAGQRFPANVSTSELKKWAEPF